MFLWHPLFYTYSLFLHRLFLLFSNTLSVIDTLSLTPALSSVSILSHSLPLPPLYSLLPFQSNEESIDGVIDGGGWKTQNIFNNHSKKALSSLNKKWLVKSLNVDNNYEITDHLKLQCKRRFWYQKSKKLFCLANELNEQKHNNHRKCFEIKLESSSDKRWL